VAFANSISTIDSKLFYLFYINHFFIWISTIVFSKSFLTYSSF